MKNKKGFTLVELLAVIALLAILVLLALPNILDVLNNAKKESFLIEVKGLDNSIKEKYINETLYGNKISEIDSESDVKLNLEGNELKYNIKLDREGNVTNITVSNNSYCVDSNKKLSDLTVDDIQDGKCVAVAKCHENTYKEGTLLHAMLKNSCAYPDNMKSKYVSLDSGIDYSLPSNEIISGYKEVIKKDVSLSIIYYNRNLKSKPVSYKEYNVTNVIAEAPNSCIDDNKFLGTAEKYYFNEKDGYFELENFHCSNDTANYDQTSIGGYICIHTGSYEENNGFYTNANDRACDEVAKVLEVSDGKIVKVDIISSNPKEPLTNGKGLYYTNNSKIVENNKKVFYYRGNVSNNNVIFNDFCWKIIRTTENENIRMIYNGRQTNGTCAQTMSGNGVQLDSFSPTNIGNGNQYVGFMYGNECSKLENCQKNENNSNIKTLVENWYSDNIYFDPNISEQDIYCNDRTAYTGGVNTYYGGYIGNILYSATEYDQYNFDDYFSLKCSSKNDKFSTPGTINGNEELKYPVGLIEANELVLAGGINADRSYNKNVYSYLYSSSAYWTMTPFYHNGYPSMSIQRNGYLSSWSVKNELGVRPVITLKSNVEITKGNGLDSNPYVIRVLER